MHATGGDLHHEEQVIRHQTAFRPYINRREIDRRQDVPMGFEKRGPGRPPLAIRRRFGAVGLENVADRLVRDAE